MGLGEKLLDWLFPPRCAFCGRIMEAAGDGICPACRRDLPRTNSTTRKADFLAGVSAPLFYEGVVRDALLHYKFRSASARGWVFGRLIAEDLRARDALRFDLISWVPLSRKRKRSRGYDQAEILARAVAKTLGREEPVPVLVKTRNVRPQSGLRTAAERRANISGCYKILDPNRVRGKRILLLDDIFTTGATMSECARVLMLAGAESVRGAALACRREDKKIENDHMR